MKPFVEYENRVEVGELSTVDGTLALRGWDVRESRSCITPYPSAKFYVTATDQAKDAIDCKDVVRFYRRRVDEEGWGMPFFYGVVETPHPLRDKDFLQITCNGPLWLLSKRQVRDLEFKGSLKKIIETWAEMWGDELWDVVDIAITEPPAFPKSIKIHNGYALDIFKVIRRFAPIYVRAILDEIKGKRILEVRDELDPVGWENDVGDMRRFHIPKKPPKEQRHVPTAEIYKKLEGDWRGFGVMDGKGKVHAEVGGPVDLNMVVDGLKGNIKKLAQMGWECVSTPRRCGWIELERNLDKSTLGPYRTPNDLLRIDGNARNTEGLYAVQRIKWSQRKVGVRWEPATLRLVLADRLNKIYIPAAMPGGPDAIANRAFPYASNIGEAVNDILNPPTPPGTSW